MYLDSVDNDDLNQQLHNTEYLNDLRQQMIKFALLQLSSFQQAEDVVQEALTSAFEHLKSFSGRAAFKTWVFAILKNKIVDLIRQKNRLITMSELFDDQENDLSIDELFDKAGHWHKYEAPHAWQSPEELLYVAHRAAYAFSSCAGCGLPRRSANFGSNHVGPGI